TQQATAGPAATATRPPTQANERRLRTKRRGDWRGRHPASGGGASNTTAQPSAPKGRAPKGTAPTEGRAGRRLERQAKRPDPARRTPDPAPVAGGGAMAPRFEGRGRWA